MCSRLCLYISQYKLVTPLKKTTNQSASNILHHFHRIGHDNKGGFAGWYLDSVTVNIPSLNCKWTCPANRWLDKKEGDKQVECDVYPTLVEETYVDIVYEEGVYKYDNGLRN